MTRFGRFLALCPLLLVLAVPARSADDEKLLVSAYFPTEVGTAWTYRVGETRYTVWVAKHEKIGKLMTARLEMYTIDRKKPVSHENIAVTGDSIVRVSIDGKPLSTPIPFLKFDAATKEPKKDESWKIDSEHDKQKVKGVFKAGLEKVKVPAGEYNTVTVKGEDLDVSGARLTLTYFFAKGVGMVRQEMKLGGQVIDVRLEKFEPPTK